MKYRYLKESEYDKLGYIHVQAFPDFFLTSLGISFLRTYYKACLKSKETIAICAEDENSRILGFAVGTSRSKGFHKRLVLQNLPSFIVQGFILVFTLPKALLRLSKNLEKKAENSDDGNYAELLSIGVLPGSIGSGIGKELVLKFEEAAKIRGCTKVALTTDALNNEKVLGFYMKSGYKVYYPFTAYPGRKMFKLIKELS